MHLSLKVSITVHTPGNFQIHAQSFSVLRLVFPVTIENLKRIVLASLAFQCPAQNSVPCDMRNKSLAFLLRAPDSA